MKNDLSNANKVLIINSILLFCRYNEEKNWDYKTEDTKKICQQNPVPKSCPEDGKTGHFTQVVWKGSVKLGIGKATGKVVQNGQISFCTWAVGRYSPAGNVEGAYANNVLKPSIKVIKV